MPSSLEAKIKLFVRAKVTEAGNQEYYRTPLVGFARADDPLFLETVREVGPHHCVPQDFLAGVQSVISFFIPFSKELVRNNRGSGPVAYNWGHSYIATNRLINHINQTLTKLLFGLGYQSTGVPATHTFDVKTLKAGWSHRSAAHVAGLGRFGLNRMLIGESGCAGRYGTLFTTAALEPGRIGQEEPCLYFKNGSCGACVKACPVQALTFDGLDRHKCYERLLENDRLLGIEGELADVCGKCISACPRALKAG